MYDRKKRQKPHSQPQSFFAKAEPQNASRDLLRLRQTYQALQSPSPDGDRLRHRMRAIQLAQQIVDPAIQSIEPILTGLKVAVYKLETGKVSAIDFVGTEESSRPYSPLGFDKATCGSWIYFADSLLHIPLEDSVIETDVYQYRLGFPSSWDETPENNGLPNQSGTTTGENNFAAIDPDGDVSEEPQTDNDDTPGNDRPGGIFGFFRRLFGGASTDND